MQMCKICLLPAATRKRVDAALYFGTSYKKVAMKFSTKARPFRTSPSLVTASIWFRSRCGDSLRPRTRRRRPRYWSAWSRLIAEFRSIADATKTQQPPWAIAAMKEIMRGLEMIRWITGEIAPANINFNNFNFAHVGEEQYRQLLGGPTEARQRPRSSLALGALRPSPAGYQR